MGENEKLLKIKAINKMILQLKSTPNLENKKTIQKLQQEINNLLNS